MVAGRESPLHPHRHIVHGVHVSRRSSTHAHTPPRLKFVGGREHPLRGEPGPLKADLNLNAAAAAVPLRTVAAVAAVAAAHQRSHVSRLAKACDCAREAKQAFQSIRRRSPSMIPSSVYQVCVQACVLLCGEWAPSGGRSKLRDAGAAYRTGS